LYYELFSACTVVVFIGNGVFYAVLQHMHVLQFL